VTARLVRHYLLPRHGLPGGVNVRSLLRGKAIFALADREQ